MQPKLKRAELDRLAEHHSLERAKIESMLEIAAAHPSPAESLRFLSRCLRIAGLLSLASGVVFFVAANWGKIAVFGRFGLVELFLAGCAALACWKTPPRIVGRSALFLAFIATGALLALFGQTYQTGADVYELFLAWALLGLPLVLLAQWSVASAAWVLVFNVALALFCGWPVNGGLLWTMFGSPHFHAAHMVLISGVVNLALWCGFDARPVSAVPDWVRRLVVTCAFVYITWAGVLSVAGSDDVFRSLPPDPLVFIGFGVTMAATVCYAFYREDDVYPLALVTVAFIVVTMVWLTRVFNFQDEAMFFLLALWLIVVSTICGRILTTLMHRWRPVAA